MEQLTAYGITEMSDVEMQETDAGIWIAIAVGLVALAWATAAY